MYPLILPNVGGEFEIVFFGLLLVLTLIYMPNGLVPQFEKIVKKFKKKDNATPMTISHQTLKLQEGKQMTNKELILSVENLTKVFGGVVAVDNVSFTINKGEIFAVIGPNGAGKTTLFNMITGVLPSSSGNVYFQDKSLTRKKPYQIAKLV